MNELFNVSSNPHIRSKVTTNGIMAAVIIALLPATGFGIYHFGLDALILILISITAAVGTEFLYGLRWKKSAPKKKLTVTDLSAVLTGLLLALNLPVSVPWWIAVIGSVFAILVVKLLFGGLGQNFMNPALGGRCFLLISFPALMTDFTYIKRSLVGVGETIDVITGATPLALLKAGESVNIMDMMIGRTAGTIGETSLIALVLGACLLLILGIIDLRVPGSYILSFLLFAIAFGGRGPDPAFLSAHLAGGGLMLGAFFMATDYVTRPVTPKGQYVYGIFLGIMTGVFRFFGPGAEGVSYAIILGNLLVPLIEKATKPKPFGWRKNLRTGN